MSAIMLAVDKCLDLAASKPWFWPCWMKNKRLVCCTKEATEASFWSLSPGNGGTNAETLPCRRERAQRGDLVEKESDRSQNQAKANGRAILVPSGTSEGSKALFLSNKSRFYTENPPLLIYTASVSCSREAFYSRPELWKQPAGRVT